MTKIKLLTIEKKPHEIIFKRFLIVEILALSRYLRIKIIENSMIERLIQTTYFTKLIVGLHISE